MSQSSGSAGYPEQSWRKKSYFLCSCCRTKMLLEKIKGGRREWNYLSPFFKTVSLSKVLESTIFVTSHFKYSHWFWTFCKMQSVSEYWYFGFIILMRRKLQIQNRNYLKTSRAISVKASHFYLETDSSVHSIPLFSTPTHQSGATLNRQII